MKEDTRWRIALQAGRLRIRFPMGSLGFFIDLILPAAPEVNSVCHGNEYQGYSLGSKDGRCVGANNLAIFKCRVFRTSGSLNRPGS